jgi:hypothetical protein
MVRDPILETAREDIESLRDSLQQGRESFFSVGAYLTFYADSPENLKKLENRITNLLESRLIYAKPALFRFLSLRLLAPVGEGGSIGYGKPTHERVSAVGTGREAGCAPNFDGGKCG